MRDDIRISNRATYWPVAPLDLVVAVPLVAENLPQRLDGIRLSCGSYKAFWDGKYLDGQREVTTGVYWCRLTVDGRPYTRRMIVQRRVTSTR
jgi:hypothetical protein